MAILALDIYGIFGSVVSILYAALGIGLVIFFHELGHFAVAKWCDVHVERFSIGFGPILWSRKRGETEYALSAIPFGGYVKMLGQDDIDPSQLTSEEISEDPRSYSAKNVWQRMGIISAGVIMNVITAVLFFAVAFQLGVKTLPATVGFVHTGMPAWKAGAQRGDVITHINGEQAESFEDIMIGVALTSGDVELEGYHPDRSTFRYTISPDGSGTRRQVGLEPTLSLSFFPPNEQNVPPVVAGTAASHAKPAFQTGDTIRKVDGKEVIDFAQLQNLLAVNRSKTLNFEVEREGRTDLLDVEVGPNHFRTLGLSMDIERISALVKGLPAEKAGLKVGDKITKVNGEEVGSALNPLKLPDVFADLHGQTVPVEVVRQTEQGSRETVSLNLVPLDRPGWLEHPSKKNDPVSIPAIGAAYHITSAVLNVEPESPADKAGIQAGARIKKVELILPEGTEPEIYEKKTIEIEIDDKQKNWATAFWEMQVAPNRLVQLTVSGSDGEEKVLKLSPQLAEDWFAPTRGIRLDRLTALIKADNPIQAVSMGVTRSKRTMIQIYLTLRNLASRDLSPEELHGPIGIAKVAYTLAQRELSALLLFLGLLSINLAVLNFLPIPVLDGGHMVFLIWEAVTRKKPSERVLIAATYCGMAFVLGLMIFVIYLDIFVHG